MENSDKSNNVVQEGFFQHVFNFDEESKLTMLNIIQFSILCVLPIIALNKVIQKYIPESDEEKGSFEIMFEIVGQLIIMFLGMLFIFRIVSYIPTYSNSDYPTVDIINIIIPFLTIVLSLQTRLGDKVNILLERLMDLISGNTSLKKNSKSPSNNSQHQPSRADNLSNMTESSQSTPQMTTMAHQRMGEVQTSPNFNNMYAGPNNPIPTNVGISIQEPLAANSTVEGFGSFI